MLNFNRPRPPEKFQEKADAELLKVEVQIEKRPDTLQFNSKFWGTYKSYFMKAQFSKCGYCEMYNSCYADVEHYRPKSVIEDIQSPGAELPNLHNVKNRKFKKSSQYGYWWLAYDWNNYLVSCELCNRPWKKSLFPLAEERPLNTEPGSEYPHVSPSREDIETPLLLNPYDDIHISSHLDFTAAGLIKPYNFSEKGKQTILTCGLDRLMLVQKRGRKAQRAMRYIEKFAQADQGSQRELEIAEDLLDLGNEEDDFAGMVRILFVRNADGLTWDDFVSYVESLQ
jgi:predicted nucleic-acid-binding Zn-ribbon protein